MAREPSEKPLNQAVGWGGAVAERYVRLVYSAGPVERLETLPERLRGGRLAAAVANRQGGGGGWE